MNIKHIAAIGAMALASTAFAQSTVMSTDTYRWQGDSIIQGEYKAWAVSPYEIQSTYSARPHFFMPISKEWKLKNDITTYPRLSGNNKLLEAVYNMGLDEMVNAVEPDTTLRTGKEWAGVWTRDVSYSIILSMAYLQPKASMISLMKKVNSEGQIIQDTGSGGAWPISTDRMVWALAAYEIYKVTGDKAWLEKVYPIIERSFAKDALTVYSDNGLVKGETSFIDWREQSYPKWMQTADIAQSEAMSTNMVHAAGLHVLADMAGDLGKKKEAKEYAAVAEALTRKINETFWMPDKGYYAMYTYGRDYPIINPRVETLGESLSILYDLAPADRQRSITENNPVTPFGATIFYPQISDMPSYHNNALWPFVAAYWALANAKVGNESGTLEAIGSIVRPAALFCTNKENFNLDNGDIFTELNSSNMLWSLSGNLALTHRILFGIHFEKDGLKFAPFVPKSLADTRKLENFDYRGAKISITVEGYGGGIKEMTFNGKSVADGFISAKALAKGGDVRIVMDSQFTPMQVNRRANAKAPWTPQARLVNDPNHGGPILNRLEWNPLEYIAYYEVIRNGRVVAKTHSTTYDASTPGEYMVVGYSAEGIPSFASEPMSNAPVTICEMAEEVTTPSSPEIAYKPSTPINGYVGGFAETDHTRKTVKADTRHLKPGRYMVYARYANGNGPVNTENRAAIRSIMVGGKKVGTVVMPHRGVGNWDDWGMSNGVLVDITEPGQEVALELLPEDENMNLNTNHALIDELVFRIVNE